MARRSYRVFVSAVTSELGSYRSEVARCLRRKGLDVCLQDDFRQGEATLLEKLRDYIRDCDAVICLVGAQYGYRCEPDHASAVGAVASFIQYSADTGETTASYS